MSDFFWFPWEQAPSHTTAPFHHEMALRHIARELAEIKRLITTQGAQMTIEMDRLKQSVADSVTVEESAITLLGQLSDAIRAAAEDPAAIAALADQVDAEKANLANAITLNTPPLAGSQLDTGPAATDPPVDTTPPPVFPDEPVDPNAPVDPSLPNV